MPLFTLNWSGKVYSKVCARLMPLFTLKWEGIFSLCSFNAIIHIELKWEGILSAFNAIIHIEVGRYIQKSVLVQCHYSHWSGKVYSKVCARLMPLFTLNWSGKVYSKVCARLMPLFTLNWSGKVYSKVCARLMPLFTLKWEGIFKIEVGRYIQKSVLV